MEELLKELIVEMKINNAILASMYQTKYHKRWDTSNDDTSGVIYQDRGNISNGLRNKIKKNL
jgi:hypothetical protein